MSLRQPSAPTKKDKNRKNDDELTKEAVAAAKSADVAVVFVGLTEDFEGEGYDRETINMPANHNALVSAVAQANPNTVVVLAGGSVVLMPWLNEVKGQRQAFQVRHKHLKALSD